MFSSSMTQTGQLLEVLFLLDHTRLTSFCREGIHGSFGTLRRLMMVITMINIETCKAGTLHRVDRVDRVTTCGLSHPATAPRAPPSTPKKETPGANAVSAGPQTRLKACIQGSTVETTRSSCPAPAPPCFTLHHKAPASFLSLPRTPPGI